MRRVDVNSLPDGWRTGRDREGAEYFYNARTKESTRDRNNIPSSPLPPNWEIAYHKEDSSAYYWNILTRETRRERPTADTAESAVVDSGVVRTLLRTKAGRAVLSTVHQHKVHH